jgi:heat-inducible transcriptional repressor
LVLPERRRKILDIIVSEYIASGVPVGSEYISRGYSLRISPATIRHEMATLEEEGYILRPHISAGGLPSDLGYRFYVESLMQDAEIEPEERRTIRDLMRAAGQEPDQWARVAVSILTQKLHSIAVATPVRTPYSHFRRVDLVAIGDLLVLVVVVLEEWKIRQRLLGLKAAVSQESLAAIANRMNDLYQGLTSREILQRVKGLSPLETEITNAVVHVMEAEDRRSYEQSYIDGWRYLLDRAEFLRSRRVQGLASALEEGSLLRRLFRSLDEDSHIRVFIGKENQENYLQECAVIMSSYGIPGRKGAVGIIGPKRLPYNRAIPVIEYVSEVMTELVNEACA